MIDPKPLDVETNTLADNSEGIESEDEMIKLKGYAII